MLLSVRSFRRRPRLAVLVLIGLAVFLVHRYRAAFQTVHLPERGMNGLWWPHRGLGAPVGLPVDVSNATLGVSAWFVQLAFLSAAANRVIDSCSSKKSSSSTCLREPTAATPWRWQPA